MTKQTFGVIVTTRSFFPSHLVKTAREKITALLNRLGFGCVMVSEEDTEFGAVLTQGSSGLTRMRLTAFSASCPISARSWAWPRPSRWPG